MVKKFSKTQNNTTGPKIHDFGSFKSELLKQIAEEKKVIGCQYVSWNPVDLVYLFELMEAVQIQQIILSYKGK